MEVMEVDEPLNPMATTLLGPVAVMAGARSASRSWSNSLGLASRPESASCLPVIL
jgi:hypothetical protein